MLLLLLITALVLTATALPLALTVAGDGYRAVDLDPDRSSNER